ncbi:AAA family ATPase [Candidatus Spongiihabitans sp.]|uniref:AAA family ATPase n=1 Tax=Candidatus Spongiihabitans sp. TaxID=3101308 RepID=UPI003C6FE7C4
MQLKKVIIKGFRSIEEMIIPFDGNGHKILVGKNECGKSNILKALHLLAKEIAFSKENKKELYSGSTYVKFIFDLEPDEINQVTNKFCQKFAALSQTLITNNLTIKAFAEKYAPSILYMVNCQSKHWDFSALPQKLTIKGKWYQIPESFVSSNPQQQEQPSPGNYIDESCITNLSEEEKQIIKGSASPIELNKIYENLKLIVKEVVGVDDNYDSPIVNWRYSEKEHDLPNSVNRNTFSESPNSCIPLKNVFLLSGIQEESINEKITEAFDRGHNQIQNLLDKVNTKTNNYINKSWKDYKNVKLKLRSDGENIVIGIQDSKNSFDFQQRSDGFRRYISFLLLMSTETRVTQEKQQLILIDEPETGLHPSSAKDLRDKLIDLGKNNMVVYATHSISMIDTTNIENNLIITKENENTKFEIAREDGTSPAENVYQAIGYSIYENLKKTNILLEGYTDKKLLGLFMTGLNWKDFGQCYTRGVSNIEHVFSMLDLVDRKYFVLSDADDSAKQKKKKMNNPAYWYTFKDLGSDAITLEDFYSEDFFTSIVEEVLGEHGIAMPESGLSEENNRMQIIKNFLRTEQKDISNEKTKENRLKDINTIISKITGEIKVKCADKVTKRGVVEEKITTMLNTFLEKISTPK